MLTSSIDANFVVIVKILSLSPPHSMEQNTLTYCPYLNLCTFFSPLGLKLKLEHLNDISLYTEALLLKL